MEKLTFKDLSDRLFLTKDGKTDALRNRYNTLKSGQNGFQNWGLDSFLSENEFIAIVAAYNKVHHLISDATRNAAAQMNADYQVNGYVDKAEILQKEVSEVTSLTAKLNEVTAELSEVTAKYERSKNEVTAKQERLLSEVTTKLNAAESRVTSLLTSLNEVTAKQERAEKLHLTSLTSQKGEASEVIKNTERLLREQITGLTSQLAKQGEVTEKAVNDAKSAAALQEKALHNQLDYLKSQLEKQNEITEKAVNEVKATAALQIENLTSQLAKQGEVTEKAVNECNAKSAAAQKVLQDRIAAIQEKHAATITEMENNYTAKLEERNQYAQKWEKVEKTMKKELFLRRLGFAFAIVVPLIVVQAIEVGLFTQLAYRDAGYNGDWIKIVGGLLSLGFQGTGLFLTINRNKVIRAIQLGVDEYSNAIYKKCPKTGEIETETFYNMNTMKVLCIVDFLINCFVLFGNTAETVDSGAIARLICFSMLTPLGIYFTSEILLNIIDKKEKLVHS